jgi:tetratricopeptide (TPR) repeat protein
MKPFLPLTGCFLGLLLSSVHAQSQEEFELRNGRRVAAESVKPTATGFSAIVVTGANAQNITFTAKDIVRANLREPAALAEARTLIASGKLLAAISLLTTTEEELLPFRQVPGAWWHRAVMLRMDALAAKGEAAAAGTAVDAEALSELPEESAALLTSFQDIIAKPAGTADTKITSLQAMAKRTADPWIAARAWLEVGNTFASQGKMEDAVKAWLRVTVFHPAERDLAVRGTILAARGLQQIERPQDGLKLLDDYLNDHLATPYESTIKAEASKIDPKRDTTPAAPAEKDPK